MVKIKSQLKYSRIIHFSVPSIHYLILDLVLRSPEHDSAFMIDLFLVISYISESAFQGSDVLLLRDFFHT